VHAYSSDACAFISFSSSLTTYNHVNTQTYDLHTQWLTVKYQNYFIISNHSKTELFIDHFSGPGGAKGPVCVSFCVSRQ